MATHEHIIFNYLTFVVKTFPWVTISPTWKQGCWMKFFEGVPPRMKKA